MIVELLGLPGSGKSTHARAAGRQGALLKRGLARHIARDVLRDPILTLALSSSRVASRLGLIRHATIGLSGRDAALRAVAAGSLARLFASDLARAFLREDTHELVDSLYREMLLGRFCAQNDISLVNDDGGVQRILSIIGLRNIDAPAEDKRSVCALLASEMAYVDIVRICLATPDMAIERCHRRRAGMPRLLTDSPPDCVRRRFDAAADAIEIIAEEFRKRGTVVERIETGA